MNRLRRALPREKATDAASGTPSVLVMTMVRDEAAMLPRWTAHYGRQVGTENLVVLDDNSSDGSTDDLPCTVHRLPAFSGTRYERKRMTLASGLASGFLAVYDYVVFVDADEFLVPDPSRYPDLPTFLAHRPAPDVLAPMALNVVHLPDSEPPLRQDLPVLGQRSFAKFTPVMCKPSVKRVPAPWQNASHGIEAPFTVDPELYLVHLKFADRDALRQTSQHRLRLVQEDGRAKGSNWARGDELVDALDRAATGVDPDRVPEFSPGEVDLGRIVQHRDGCHRAVGVGQVRALEKMPLRRVPSSLLGTI